MVAPAKGPVEQLRTDLIACLRVGGRPILWGPAGVGKTQLAFAIARELKKPVYLLIGSLCDPTDIAGFPVVRHDVRVEDDRPDPAGKPRSYPVLEFAPREMFVRMNQNPAGGCLVIDEMTGNAPAVQSALLTLLKEGRAGDLQLNLDKVAILAAANPPDEAVNGQELGGPMVNRLDHFHFPTGPTAAAEWCTNFPGYWDHPPRVGFDGQYVPEECMIRARSLVAAFVRRFPKHWHLPPGVAADDDGTKKKRKQTAAPTDPCTAGWASARSLDRASWHIGYALWRGQTVLDAMPRVVAAVGPVTGVEFTAYARTADVPDPEAVLKDPAAYRPTGRVDTDHATLDAVAAAVAAKLTADRLLAAYTVARRAVETRTDHGEPIYEAAMSCIHSINKLFRNNLATLSRELGPKKFRDYYEKVRDVSGPFRDLVDALGIEAPKS